MASFGALETWLAGPVCADADRQPMKRNARASAERRFTDGTLSQRRSVRVTARRASAKQFLPPAQAGDSVSDGLASIDEAVTTRVFERSSKARWLWVVKSAKMTSTQ